VPARLRAFRANDLPALEAVRAAAFAPIFRGFAEAVGPRIAPVAFAGAEAEQARLLAEICAPGSGQSVLVAEVAGAVVGFVAFSCDTATRLGEIGLNAVHPDHAGRGIGTAMYVAALRRMEEAGMQVATVSTGGDAGHAPARRAYAKLGFGAPIPSVTLHRVLRAPDARRGRDDDA
jgi:ribosomal protein S18 acetylase RimI-like enzyme